MHDGDLTCRDDIAMKMALVVNKVSNVNVLSGSTFAPLENVS